MSYVINSRRFTDTCVLSETRSATAAIFSVPQVTARLISDHSLFSLARKFSEILIFLGCKLKSGYLCIQKVIATFEKPKLVPRTFNPQETDLGRQKQTQVVRKWY